MTTPLAAARLEALAGANNVAGSNDNILPAVAEVFLRCG